MYKYASNKIKTLKLCKNRFKVKGSRFYILLSDLKILRKSYFCNAVDVMVPVIPLR